MTDIEKYILTRWLYSIGEETLISDSEYSNLHLYLKDKGLVPEYTNRAWSSDPCPIELLRQNNLSEFIYDIKLLDKTESIESITSELDATRFYRERIGLYTVSFKIDGWNLQLTYYNGELIKVTTRGRESDALVVEVLKKYLPRKIPKMGEVRIVGELGLSHASFAELKRMFPNKQMKSQRASVRTALANEEAAHLLTFLAFDIISNEGEELGSVFTYYQLNKWGFKTPDYLVARSGAEVMNCIKVLSDREQTYGFISDGTVVRSDKGRELRAVRIYSWEESVYYSYVVGVEEEHSSSSFGCKLLVYPIRTIHGTQERVNITNLKRIQENRLYPGSPIAFVLRSDAIADPDLSTTRYLQEMWNGRYEDFKERIIIQEAVKTEKMLQKPEEKYESLRNSTEEIE